MADTTTIEWTATRLGDGTVLPGFTFNPWTGCTKVSPACRNCYAEGFARRNSKVFGQWGPGSNRKRTSDANWRKPLKWNREAKASGIRRKVFCASMADVFEDRPELVEWRLNLWRLIDQTPHLDWLLLTKRPDVMADWAAEHGWPANAWAGTTVEDQRRADERIPHLLQVPAKVRFLSCEPLLEPVDLSEWMKVHLCCGGCGATYGLDEMVPDPEQHSHGADCCARCGTIGCMSSRWGEDARSRWCGDIDAPPGDEDKDSEGCALHWVITGGESGPHARPSHPDWFRHLRDQCKEADCAFFLKQRGRWTWDRPDGLRRFPIHCVRVDGGVVGHPDPGVHKQQVWPVGKKSAGRQLDGRTWDQVPEVNP